MLEELSISNIALVERATIRFTAGMNCLTGETGAGKSILAGALGLLRGDKGEVDLIRTGTQEAVVSGTFAAPKRPEISDWLRERGLETEDGKLFIRRILRREGKSSIYVQGQPLSLKELTELSGLIFDMHGQHEHQSLFVVDNHRLMLDRFGGHEEDALALYSSFAELAGLTRQREKLVENERDRQRRQEYLSYAVNEIQEAKLVAGEDKELEDEKRVLSQSEKLFSLVADAYEQLSASGGGALAQFYKAKQELHNAAAIDSALEETHARVENLYYELEDIAHGLQAYRERTVFDPGRIEQLEERLNLLQKLKKKYGPELADVVRFGEESAQELSQLENFDQNLEDLNRSIKDIEQRVLSKAAELSRVRKQTALRLKAAVEKGLASLSMGKTVFEVSFKQKESERGTPVCGPYGIDIIEFLLSSNPGEPLKPLKNVASGGEISRIMLSIKSALADSDHVSSLVFDEVDTGIGGEVAVALAEHLYNLSRSKQILAITHLASIAVRADNHLRVEKVLKDGRTSTLVESVEGRERVAEIARMLSGDKTGEMSLSHASELLRRFRPEFAAI